MLKVILICTSWPRSARLSGWRFLICPGDNKVKVTRRFPAGEGPDLPESVSGTPGRDSPTSSIVRVAPQKVTHRSLVGHLLQAVKCPENISIKPVCHLVEEVTGCGQECLCWDWGLRAGRRSGHPQGRSGEGSRTGRWNTYRDMKHGEKRK